MITLHGVPPSPFVRKVRVVLAEKKLEYRLETLIPFPKTEDLLRRSPLGKIPVFEEDGFETPDSSVICAYLERTRPEPRLYPADPRELARALWFEEYADTRLADTVGPVFFQRIVRPGVFKEATDQAVVEEALSVKLPPVFEYLEGQVANPAGIVAGRFTIADVALGTQLVNFHGAGETIDPKRWPKLSRYYASITARPSFRGLLEEERRSAEAA